MHVRQYFCGERWKSLLAAFEFRMPGRRDAGISLSQQILRPEDLYGADEVFISSTNRNVISVGEIAGRKITNPAGPVAAKLNEIFSAYVTDYVERRVAAAR